MIELIKGSVFDSKCDLLIIPCNSYGGMTTFVLNNLFAHKLPTNIGRIPAGEVYFSWEVGDIPFASAIGYAASVDVKTRSSSETIIRNIAKNIKQFCQKEQIKKINIPLLGTGAGGLDAIKSYGILKDEFFDVPQITLCVYVVNNINYSALESAESKMKIAPEPCKIKNPRVFISYTGTDPDNRTWVKNLADRLRTNGIDAHLDMFHLKPGQDLPQWMTNEVIMADKVLLICDKYYAEKADNRKAGVGWETMIIQGDMLLNQNQNKYIAIIRDKNANQSLPIYVKSRYALNWSDDERVEKEFNDLLCCLFDCDIVGPLGEIPSFIKEKLLQKAN